MKKGKVAMICIWLLMLLIGSLFYTKICFDKADEHLPRIINTREGRRLDGTSIGYGLTTEILSSNLEQVISLDGKVYDNVEDVQVAIECHISVWWSFGLLQRDVSYVLTVPAISMQTIDDSQQVNECPVVIPSVAEWSGGVGSCNINIEDDTRVQYTLSDQLSELGKEGYLIIIGGTSDDTNNDTDDDMDDDTSDIIQVRAYTDIGLFYAKQTLKQLSQRYGDHIPCGMIRDYPTYSVRGIGIDVARKPVSLETLYRVIDEMSYYKLNDLQIHLNDNALMVYSDKVDSLEHAFTAYSAFRLESRVLSNSGESITAKDFAYTMEDWMLLTEYGAEHGVCVVPEIDTPAHSLSITSVYPEYADISNCMNVDNLDITNPKTVELVLNLWDDYLAGDSCFSGNPVVGAGLDEAYVDSESYRNYMSTITEHLKSYGKSVRIWGSLSAHEGETEISSDHIQMNIWKTSWANPVEMYELGYSLINSSSMDLYIIPGGGYDHLDTEKLYTDWKVNLFESDEIEEVYEIPYDSPQMLGASIFVWNDLCDNLSIGICEYDILVRLREAMPVFAERVWSKNNRLSYDNFMLAVSEMSFPLEATATIKKLEPDYEVRFDVYISSEAPQEIILAETESEYGVHAFYLRQSETGQVGFSRENYNYTFDYIVPEEEWVNLRIVGRDSVTSLYVNGDLVDTVGSTNTFEEHASFVFPLEGLLFGEESEMNDFVKIRNQSMK